MQFSISRGMLMGVATASMQIEGGQLDANWHDWHRRGFIKDGSDPSAANDHWERWCEVAALMADMGLQLDHFCVEWARLMPEEGRVDEAAVERYRQELLLLKANGIRPLLTIHHFSNPVWFEKKGAFEKRENLHHYLELVELVIDRFGDLCSDYITINEPNVYATNSYFFGLWPPGRKDVWQTLKVMENLAYCHISAMSKMDTSATKNAA